MTSDPSCEGREGKEFVTLPKESTLGWIHRGFLQPTQFFIMEVSRAGLGGVNTGKSDRRKRLER